MSRFEEVPVKRKGKKEKEKSEPPNFDLQRRGAVPSGKLNVRDLNKKDRLKVKSIQTKIREQSRHVKDDSSIHQKELEVCMLRKEPKPLQEDFINAYRVKDNEIWLAKHAKQAERHRRFCILAFLSCRRKIGLSKDLMRYICSFLDPRCDLIIYNLDHDSMFGRMYHLNRKIPTVEILGVDDRNSERESVVFDAEDEEIWVFNKEIHVFNMKEESWREVKNEELEGHLQPGQWYFSQKTTFFWMEGMLFTFSKKRGVVETFSCDNSSRTLKKVEVKGFLGSRFWAEFSYKFAKMRTFLFCWRVAEDCHYYPDDERCPGVHGFYKRLRPGCCCSALGVIDTNNLEHGWTFLPVPDVHYFGDSAKLVIDGGKLMIFGGIAKGFRISQDKKIEGCYTLNLWERNLQWRFHKLEIPKNFAVVRGKIMDLEQAFPNEFCDGKDRKKVVVIEYD